jgi:hypothetical protein
MTNKQVVELRPDPARVFSGKYVYGEAVPVNIFIDGQKVEAPKAGVKIGRPLFPDTDRGGLAVVVGDYIDDKEANQ